MEHKCIVKIAVSSEKDYYHIEDVVYYRSGMTPDFIERWLWYFDYLASRIKVANPKRRVEIVRGPQDIKLGREWHEYRRGVLIKTRSRKLKELEKGVINDDLFHFASTDNEKKKKAIQHELELLENDQFPIQEFPEYINKIKDYI